MNGDPEVVRDAIEQRELVETAIVPEDTPSPAATSTASPDGEFVVEIPGRRPGERTLLAVPDQQTADELRHLVNAFRRGEALAREREALGRWREELQLVEEALGVDPDGARGLAAIMAYHKRRGHAPDADDTTAPPPPPPQPPRPPRRVTARRVGNMRY